MTTNTAIHAPTDGPQASSGFGERIHGLQVARTGVAAQLAVLNAGDVVSFTMAGPDLLEGTYLTMLGMHFVQRRGAGLPPWGECVGPLDPGAMLDVRVIKTLAEIQATRFAEQRGERFPGREPSSAEDFAYRLELLASAIARESDAGRRAELKQQFEDLADVIRLAAGKRNWMLSAARWALKHNAPPSMRDLWFSDVASPSLMARPRAQDFDPDPQVRRKRPALPDHVANDPMSIARRLSALRAAGFRARVTLAGDPAHDKAVLTVELPEDRKARFIAYATRQASGVMAWDVRWSGNDSASGYRKARRATAHPSYRTLRDLLGLRSSRL